MTQSVNNKYARITLLFAVTYMISYITRINYGAIISEIVNIFQMKLRIPRRKIKC